MPCPPFGPLITNNQHLSHIAQNPTNKTQPSNKILSFNMRCAAAIAMTLTLLSTVFAQLPILGQFPPLPAVGGSDGPNCSNQNGLVNAAFLTHTNCYGNGAGTGSMSCGNQVAIPTVVDFLAGLLGSGNALLNVNALSTVDCYN
ncbi:hypothetical protein KEM48_001038 [Puccinia striiformis f. sp. tritici PST-130]|nr:hypothetical protein KEM48_001038 [Puccinia striiformis f. sp. tritici PST-130]